MTANTLLGWLRRLCLIAWLRCKLRWVEIESRGLEEAIFIAEAEAAFLPGHLESHQAIAADLRTQLVALRGLPSNPQQRRITP